METLPEVVAGCVRLSRINIERCPLVVADASDWLLGTCEPHGARRGGDDS